MESLLHASSSLVSLRPRIDGRRESKSLPMLKKKKSKKDDNHGFSVRPDEATGPFPESILLKEVLISSFNSGKNIWKLLCRRRSMKKVIFFLSLLMLKKVRDLLLCLQTICLFGFGGLYNCFFLLICTEEELYDFLDLQLQSDFNEERMRHYEVVYLIHEKHAEVESINEKVQEFIKEKKGKVWRFSDWGMRRPAYKIHKAENAHYILMNF